MAKERPALAAEVCFKAVQTIEKEKIRLATIKEAENLTRQAKEVSTILSSSLGCDIGELVDLEMIKYFEWEMFSPTTSEELRDELF